MNLALPDAYSQPLFGETVSTTDVGPPAGDAAGPATLTRARQWPTDGAVRSGAPRELRLWRPLLDGVDFFTHAHFKIVRGRFLDADESRYASDVRFEAVARLTSGRYASVDSKVELSWSRHPAAPGGGEAAWRIDSRWRVSSALAPRAAIRVRCTKSSSSAISTVSMMKPTSRSGAQ